MKRNDLDLASYKTQLLALKASAEETIARMNAADDDGLNTTGSDRSDNKTIDLGTEVQLRTQDAALIENERGMLAQIEGALAKLEDGTYGLSEQSGEPIPRERLDAIPYATLTVAEAEAGESDRTATQDEND